MMVKTSAPWTAQAARLVQAPGAATIRVTPPVGGTVKICPAPKLEKYSCPSTNRRSRDPAMPAAMVSGGPPWSGARRSRTGTLLGGYVAGPFSIQYSEVESTAIVVAPARPDSRTTGEV